MNKNEIREIKNKMGNHENWKDENSMERKTYEEMSCREMIMSCLTYRYNIYNSEYVMKYIDILGEQRVLELCKEQEEYFNTKCKVNKGVYTDNEGVTYNSLVEEV